MHGDLVVEAMFGWLGRSLYRVYGAGRGSMVYQYRTEVLVVKSLQCHYAFLKLLN
jgi:hypothetical protein